MGNEVVSPAFSDPVDAIKHAAFMAKKHGERFCVVEWGLVFKVKRLTLATGLNYSVLEICRP